jgi:TPP-dependent pyruvate/acetoin dehydrogenase alpha subunit
MRLDITEFSLGGLADPKCYNASLQIKGLETAKLVDHLISMIKIRLVERKLAEARSKGIIGGPVHLGVGQEAVAVGLAKNLRTTDRIFGAHRSHAHILSLGASVYRLFAEVLGKDTGHSRGMGGSMHLWDQSVGFYGSVPIVSGTVPLAVGAGLAAKMQNSGDVAVAYLGDGAVEEGVVHESLNLARIWKIPIIFVVENNLFASHMHISLRQPMNATSRFAYANDIPYRTIDGNDVVLVEQVAKKYIEQARNGEGAAFIEAVTYRWYGHVDWREDIDVGVNRSESELTEWRKRDPIRRLSLALIENGVLSENAISDLSTQIRSQINEDWKKAEQDPYPSTDQLIKRVYADECHYER